MYLNKLFKLGAITLLLLLIVACSNDVATVSANQAADMLNKKQAIIVDVREQDERNEEYIEGTLFIPLAQLESRLDELAAYKNRPIIVQCRSGRRSNIAGANLLKAGFKQVLNLEGGILAWNKQGLATVKGVAAK
ncbi:MAG: rhodanese-like domain-containing protein [Methylotenera sp.]|jgi:rhodanese-related sulfurtransferase